MRKLLLIIVLLAVSLGAVAQVDQYKVRARLFLQTDSFLIWRGDTIDFDQLISLQQLIDSLNNYANQHLSSTKGGNNVAVNITGGDGTMFSVADGDSVATNELQTISISNDTIYLSNTGGNVKLPSGADNWGTQVVVPAADSLLRGKGTTASPLYADTAKIATQYDISLLGNVTKVGTPANDQVGVWTGNGTIEGDADLTFDGNKLKAKQFYISSPTAGDSDYDKFLVLDATGTEVKTRTGSQLLSDIGAQASLTTGNLTESVTGLQFSATRSVIGGAAALSLTSGYVIPTTTQETNWTTAYTHASSGDADVSATNEIQNLSKSKAGNNVTVNISGGTGTTFSVADADSSVTNEIQTISISNDTIYLSKSGGNVKLPSGADNWGTQVVVPAADSLLRGKGTTASPLYADTAKLATQYDLTVSGSKWTDNGSDLVPTGSERINVTVNQSGQNVGNFANTHASGLGLSIVAADTVNSAFSVADYQANNRFTITGDGDIYASSLDYENTADQVVTYNSTTDKLSYYDYAPNPFTPDTYGLTYSGGNIGLGIASQANNGLYVRDSTGSYNYAAIIENKHAGGGGLRVNIPGSTNLYYPLRLYGNSAEVFGVTADGSITVKETSGTIPGSGYGAIYAKTDSKLYYRSDGGTEYDLTLGEGGEGSTSPGGSSGDIQYNNGGSFGGFGDWNGTTLTVPGELAISSSFTTTSAQPVGISSSGYISLYNISAPSAPSSTTGRLYMDSGDDKLYFKNSANTYDLTAATSGSGWVDNGTTVDLSTSSDNVGIGETGSSSCKCIITATGSQGGLVASTSSSGYDAIYARNYSTSDLNNASAGYFITDGTGLAIALQAQVNSGGGSGSCAINATNSSTSASTVYGGYFGCTSGANGIGVRSAGSAYDFYAAGGGTDYGSSSSIRWKTNIMVIPDALKKVNKLRGVYFDWDKQHGGGHSVGFIAEEVGKVLPEIVQYEKNGTDASGMDYSKITPLLLQAIKELSGKVDKLEKEVNRLKRYMPY